MQPSGRECGAVEGCATSSRTYRRNRHHLHQVSSCDAVPGNMVRCPIRSRLSTPELIPRSRRTPRDSAERSVDGFGSPVEMLLRHEQIRRHRRHRHVPRWPHERVDESVNTFTEPDRLDWARRSSGCGPLVGRSARGSQESGAAGRELHLPGRRASGRRNADVEAMEVARVADRERCSRGAAVHRRPWPMSFEVASAMARCSAFWPPTAQ
jgi:hypothetical protein